MRRVVLIAALVLAGCGGSSPDPAPRLDNGDTGVGVPDGGAPAGHTGDLEAQFARTVRGSVRVPEADRTPPLALLELDTGAGKPVVHDSPVRSERAAAVRLAGPELRATALIRDADGGTGRIRVSVVYVTRCDGVERQRAAYFPQAQLETIRIAPGVRVPAQRSRSAHVRFTAGCSVTGKAFAEATNAHSLESFSDPIWFEY